MGSLYIEEDCVYKSEKYCSRGDSRTWYSSWRPFPQKQSDESFTNPPSMLQLQLLNIWLLITAPKGEKDGVMITKPGHLMIGNIKWSGESSFTLFTTLGRVYVWTSPKEAYNPECLVPTVKHGARSVMIWAPISSILLVLYLLWMVELLPVTTWIF